uniref:Uncharacterized protein n=1 Tax=Ascaris lumbricoides TaxID=6252 RepID=A0A0M3I6Q2_ASCLU
MIIQLHDCRPYVYSARIVPIRILMHSIGPHLPKGRDRRGFGRTLFVLQGVFLARFNRHGFRKWEVAVEKELEDVVILSLKTVKSSSNPYTSQHCHITSEILAKVDSAW